MMAVYLPRWGGKKLQFTIERDKIWPLKEREEVGNNENHKQHRSEREENYEKRNNHKTEGAGSGS